MISFVNPERPRYLKALIPLLCTGFILFFIGGPDYYSFRSFQSFWNLGHIAFFAGFTFLFITLIRPVSTNSYSRQVLWTLSLTLGFGICVECLQYGINRSPDLHDILRNLIGALVTLMFLAPKRNAMGPLRLIVSQGIVGMMVFLELVPFAIDLTDEIIAMRQFPLLSGFEVVTETDRWEGSAAFSIDTAHASEGSRSLLVQLNTTTYSGISLSHFPGNWSGYNLIRFSVFNPSTDPLRLTCRIHDIEHTRGVQRYQDRFNRSFTVTTGWNVIDVSLDDVIKAPENRTMDITAIKGVGIFATRLPAPRTMYIDDVRLIKTP